MKTKMIGLWKGRTAWYASKPMTQAQISELPKKCRILLRYNKYYEKDSNKPMFVFVFADAEDYEAIAIERDTKEYINEVDDLKEALSQIRSHAIYGQDACENYDEVYRYLDLIEQSCNKYLV